MNPAVHAIAPGVAIPGVFCLGSSHEKSLSKDGLAVAIFRYVEVEHSGCGIEVTVLDLHDKFLSVYEEEKQ